MINIIPKNTIYKNDKVTVNNITVTFTDNGDRR